MDDLVMVERVLHRSLTFRNGNPMQDGDLATVEAKDLRALCDRLILYREAVAQANVDILTVLGAVRDDMPAEAVAIFQRIARDLGAVLSRSGG